MLDDDPTLGAVAQGDGLARTLCPWGIPWRHQPWARSRDRDLIRLLSSTNGGGASVCWAKRRLCQPSRRMRKQGIDQAGLRYQMIAYHRGFPLVACNFVQQPFEFGDVAVRRLFESTVGAILAGDLVKRLLTSRRVEPLCEGVAFTALIAVPHLADKLAVHQAADIERQGIQRIRRRSSRRCLSPPRDVAFCRIGVVQQIRKPAVPVSDRRLGGLLRAAGWLRAWRRRGRRIAVVAHARRGAYFR